MRADGSRPNEGRPRIFQTPEDMWDDFLQYKEHAKANPLLIHDFVGKDGMEVYRKKEVPLTIEGFKCWLFEASGFKNFDIDRYLTGSYPQFVGIVNSIKESIRQDQIKGGMGGIYNASITARINGLVEKTQQTLVQEQPLFSDEKKE